MPPLIERIRWRFLRPDSEHYKILVGIFWVSLFVLVGKVASAAKEMTIAWRYGVSATVDAYVFLMSVINWPVDVWSAIVTVVLIPLVARLRVDGAAELPRFRSEMLGLTLLVGMALGLLMWLGVPPMLRAGWLGLSGPALERGLSMAPGLAWLAPLGAMSGLFSALLLAAGRHRNTLFEAIPALTLLVFLLLPGWIPEPLLWGTLAGFALQMAALAAPLQMYGELQRPSFSQRSPEWKFFWGSIGIMAIGQVLASVTNIIDQFFAAGLDTGALSMLGYANRVLALATGLGATAISRATLPVFAQAHAEGSTGIYSIAVTWSKLMLFAGVVALLIGWFFAPLMVKLLFERGAFTSENTQAVAALLRISLFQLPLFFATRVFLAALVSNQKYGLIALSGAINLIAKIPLVFIMVKFWRLEGLVLSTACMYTITAIFLYIVFRRSSRHTG